MQDLPYSICYWGTVKLYLLRAQRTCVLDCRQQSALHVVSPGVSQVYVQSLYCSTVPNMDRMCREEEVSLVLPQQGNSQICRSSVVLRSGHSLPLLSRYIL